MRTNKTVRAFSVGKEKRTHRFWAETVYCKYEDHRIRQERGRRVRAQMGVFPQPRLLRFQLNRRRLYEFRLAMPVRGVQDDELYPRFGLVLPFGERPIGGVDGRGVFLPFSDKQPRRRERNAALSVLPTIISSAEISSGSSGGTLLNEYGHVIAVTSGSYLDANGLYISVPVDTLLQQDFTAMTLRPISELDAPAD